MGGQSTQQQNANQNQSLNAVGSQNSTQNSGYTGNQTQFTTPWAQTNPLLSNLITGLNTQPTGINPQQQGAIDILMQQAQAGNPFTSMITGATGGLLQGGGANALNPQIQGLIDQYQGALSPILNQTLGAISPALQATLDQQASDVSNRITSQFAGAGRDVSPGNSQAVARGITAANNPILANQYNTQVSQMLQAGQQGLAGALAGYGLMGNNNQNAISNILQGITTGVPSSLNALSFTPQMMLAAQSLQQGIPQQNLQYLASLGLPLAQAFGTQTGTNTGTANQTGTQTSNQIQQGQNLGQTNTTNNPSLLQDALGWSQVFSNLFGGQGGGGAGNAAKLLIPK